MITEPNEFMQKLQELQDSSSVTYSTLPSDEPRFIIDANSRTIKIPPEFQFLGVKNDHNAETVYFEIDRYFDNEDLSQHTCVVQFSNKNNSNDGGFYPVTTMDTTSVDGKIIFGWEIKSDATSIVGDIYFSVRFYSINSTDYVFTYNFNTLTAKSVILDTLDVDNPGIFENYPSELDAWLDRMNELEAGTSGKVEEIEAKGQEVLTEINSVKDSIPEDYSTLSSDVDGLKVDLSQLDNDFLNLDVPYVYSQNNKYNRGIVTTSSITSEKYLNNGIEVEDVRYAYTPLLSIVGGKEYSIGLVPAFGSATLPWYGCENGITFYDKDEKYIGQTIDTTFKAPINAKYYRLNLCINREGLYLDTVNKRCVLVYGDTLPSEYVSYEKDKYFRDYLSEENLKLNQNILLSNENKNVLTEYKEKTLSLTSGSMFSLVIMDFYSMGDCWYSILENDNYNTILVTSKANKNVPPVVFFNGAPSSQTYIGYDNCNLNSDTAGTVYDYEVTIPNNCTHFIVQSGWNVIPKLKTLEYFNFKNNDKPIEFSVENDILSVTTKFKNDELKVTIGKRGPNNIVDFRTIDVGSTSIYANITDWHSPLVVKAKNNGDGDHADYAYFTGGNHSFNNTGSGAATGRSDNLKFYADGNLLSNDDNGFANNIRIEWENYVQGYNTTKEDGSGREIIKEIHKLVFDGIQWTSDVSYIPLEDIVFEVLYGFQCSGTNSAFPNIRYIGGANRGLYSGSENNNSGNRECNMFVAYGDIFKVEMEVDTRIDLGDRHLYTGTKGCFNNNYGKAYFNFLSNVEMNGGDMYSIRGYYRFLPM